MFLFTIPPSRIDGISRDLFKHMFKSSSLDYVKQC